MANRPLKRILYADGELETQAITQISLEDMGGFTLIICNNGYEALEKAQIEQPDLLLLNITMPGMDGPTTLSELRDIPGFKEIPAIFMAATIEPEEISKYKKMGVIDIITKPFDPILLSSYINAIWERYTASCELKC